MTEKPESLPSVEYVHGAHPPRRHEVIVPKTPLPRALSRRTFFRQMSGVTVATLATGSVGTALLAGPASSPVQAAGMGPADLLHRRGQAYRLRHDAALAHSNLPLPTYPTNRDEAAYHPTTMANFTKGLPHNALGEGERTAYEALLQALTTGQSAAFEAIPLGGQLLLANPQAAYAFELEGLDPHHVTIPAPPAFSSAEMAAEMVELYWQALSRDVPFAAYETHPLIQAAVADLSRLSAFRGPLAGERVTPATLFRGPTPGDLTGPYLSQFLWHDVPSGVMTLVQRGRVPIAGNDYMTAYPDWLNIQRGLPPTQHNVLDATPRYLRHGRDLGVYVHRDFTFQAFLNAGLILLAMRAPLATNPYTHSRTQSGFVTFGAPHVLDLVGRVANAALKATWCHKWLIHRRLRPEEFAGRVHQTMTGAVRYPIHADVLNAVAPSTIFRASGTYLLPMAYPEGCPLHPAYPAGHAAIAGACTTVLKAFFKESFVLPNPVVASPDGLSLLPYRGPDLTVGGELNKLASNIAMGRDTAGVHWRSDGIEGIKLGEAVALGILRDLRATYHEDFQGFALTTFAGTSLTMG